MSLRYLGTEELVPDRAVLLCSLRHVFNICNYMFALPLVGIILKAISRRKLSGRTHICFAWTILVCVIVVLLGPR